jgi:hypothetical protein
VKIKIARKNIAAAIHIKNEKVPEPTRYTQIAYNREPTEQTAESTCNNFFKSNT